MASGGRTRAPYTQAEVDRIRRLAETHGTKQAAAIAGTCMETVASMRRRGWRVGKKGLAERPIPSDFAIQAAHLTILELVEHYGSSTNTVLRWSNAIERPHMTGHRFRSLPIPADLEHQLELLTTSAAVGRHYGVHPQTVAKWRRDLAAGVAAERAQRGLGWIERFAPARSPQSSSGGASPRASLTLSWPACPDASLIARGDHQCLARP